MEDPEIIDLVSSSSSSEDDESYAPSTEVAAERKNAPLIPPTNRSVTLQPQEYAAAAAAAASEGAVRRVPIEDSDSMMSVGEDSEISSEEDRVEQVAVRGEAQKPPDGSVAATAGAASANAFPFLVSKGDGTVHPEMYLRSDLSSFMLLKMGRKGLLTRGKVELDLTVGSSADATVVPTYLTPHAGANYAGVFLKDWRTASNTLHILKGDTAVFSYRGLVNGRHNFMVKKQAAAAAPPPVGARGPALQRQPQLQTPGDPLQDDAVLHFFFSSRETSKGRKRRRAEAAARWETFSDDEEEEEEEEERERSPAAWNSPHVATIPGAGPSSAPHEWGDAGMPRRQRVPSNVKKEEEERIQWSDAIEPPRAGAETVFEMEVQNEYPGGQLYFGSDAFRRLLAATMGLQPLQLGKRAVPVELQLGEAKVLHCKLARERERPSGRLSGWSDIKSSLGLLKGDILQLNFLGRKTAAPPSTKKKVVLRMRKLAGLTVPQNVQQQETAKPSQQVQQQQPPPQQQQPEAGLFTPGVTESSVRRQFEALLPELVLEAQRELAAEGYAQDAADVAAIQSSLRERFFEKEMVELMEMMEEGVR